MNNNITQQTTDLIKQDFELSQINKDGTVTEEQLLDVQTIFFVFAIREELRLQQKYSQKPKSNRLV